MASPRDSPATDDLSDRILESTFRNKALQKRNVNKHHNNNMSAGYVPVLEDDPDKTSLWERNTYIFWTVLIVISVVALVNLIILLIMFSVLRIGLGMKNLEVISEQSMIKLYGRTDLGTIFKRNGLIVGFTDESLVLTGDGSQLYVDILASQYKDRKRVLTVDKNDVFFQNVQSFEVKHPKTGKNILSTKSSKFNLNGGVRHLHVDHVAASHISSPVDENLVLRSDSSIRLKGNEGTRIEGKHVFWSADQFLLLKSENGTIILNGTKGVTVDMSQMPIATTSSSSVSQYKVCVCMPSGKLFRVKVLPGHSSKYACNRVNMLLHSDPCNIT